MKKSIVFFCMCILSSAAISQQLHNEIYKVYKKPIRECRDCEEKIILYTDGSFNVYSCLGGMAIQYNGGWWINDSLLILQPSQNCKGPLLLSKEEYYEKNKDSVSIEVYNENGKLLHYSVATDQCQINTIHSDGCIVANIKENLFFRYFNIYIKGSSLPPIKTSKRNNRIEIILLEPSTSSDVYIGKQTIPLTTLKE